MEGGMLCVRSSVGCPTGDNYDLREVFEMAALY